MKLFYFKHKVAQLFVDNSQNVKRNLEYTCVFVYYVCTMYTRMYIHVVYLLYAVIVSGSIVCVHAYSARNKDQKLVGHFLKMGYFMGYYTAVPMKMYGKFGR